MYSRRSLQSVGTLTVEEGQHMVRQLDDGERAKAERLLKRLEEKDSIARVWRREGELRPLYIVDVYGKGRELVRS
jgi:muconolactone delta-isomerase